MANVNTNFDQALQGYAKLQQALERTRTAVRSMGASASEAKSCLKDSVSAKNLGQIEELVKSLETLLGNGEERVRELEMQTRSDKTRYEEMEAGR